MNTPRREPKPLEALSKAHFYRRINEEQNDKHRERERERARSNPDANRKKASDWYHANRERAKNRILAQKWSKKLELIAALGAQCARCPARHPAVLTFHHLDPTSKLFEIGGGALTSPRKYPWELVLAEAQKCELLCANCHALENASWFVEQWDSGNWVSDE